MKILVTGINGFVGKYLERSLISRGHSITGLDTASSSPDVIAADITSEDAVNACIKETAPDAVIHLAGIANVDYKNPSKIYDVNFKGTVNLLSACAALGKKTRFLFISSSQVYGNGPEKDIPISENAPVSPVNHYGASKAAAELAVSAFSKETAEMECMIARPFNHTGTGQSGKFVVPKIVEHFKNNSAEIELGNIHTIRDISNVEDVVAAYALMIEKAADGAVYNIASGQSMRISDIVASMEKISGRKINILKKEFLVRPNDIGSVAGNADRIKKDLGWKPLKTLEDTLKDMYFS